MRNINKFVRENNFVTEDISTPGCKGLMVHIPTESRDYRALVRCYGADDYEAEIYYKLNNGKYSWLKIYYATTQKQLIGFLQELL